MEINRIRPAMFGSHCEILSASSGDWGTCKSLHTTDKRRVEPLYGSWYVFSIRCHVKILSHIQSRHTAVPRCAHAYEVSLCSPWWILSHIRCICTAFRPYGCVCVSAARRLKQMPCRSQSIDRVSLQCGSLCVCLDFLTRRNASHNTCTGTASRLCDYACEDSGHVCF